MIDLETLRSRRDRIQLLGCRYGAGNIRVFGSIARGEETDKSDVDLLVDFAPGRSLLDLAGFELALEDLLHCRVDVVADGGIHPLIEDRILNDAVPL